MIKYFGREIELTEMYYIAYSDENKHNENQCANLREGDKRQNEQRKT